jgi:hypothetical protein
MPIDEQLTPAERELEATLQGVAPSPAALRADRVAIQAARDSGARRARAWQAASIFLALGLASLLIAQWGGTFFSSSHSAQAPGLSPADRMLEGMDRVSVIELGDLKLPDGLAGQFEGGRLILPQGEKEFRLVLITRDGPSGRTIEWAVLPATWGITEH